MADLHSTNQPLINIIINSNKEENPLKKALEKKRFSRPKVNRSVMLKMLAAKLKDIEKNTRIRKTQTDFIGGSG